MTREVLQLPPIAAHALWAATYDRIPNPLLSLEERIVEPLLPLMDRLVAVDVACGTGRWLENLVRRGARIAVGLDLSPEMLRQAVLKPALSGRLIEADCLAMPLCNASVDFAVSSFCLGYITDMRGFAKELSRIVRPGGYLVLSDFHPTAHARGWKRSFRHDNTVVEISNFPRPLNSILETFADEGFEVLRSVEPGFGEADRSSFEGCGKEDLFRELLGEVAIFVCLFRCAGESFRDRR